MYCLNPVTIKTVNRWEYPDGLTVPCGKCLRCRIKNRSEWTMRLWQELSYWQDYSFVTLTYDEDHVPENHSLRMTDLQKYFKRQRKYNEQNNIGSVMYFAAGEYGDETYRPHYHIIWYGLGLRSDHVKAIKQCWRLGGTYHGGVSIHSIRYVAQYIDKKYNGDLLKEVYTDTGRENVFRLLSKGIGRRFCDDNADQLKTNLTTLFRGKEVSLPRYYINRLDLSKSPALKALREQMDIDENAKYLGLHHESDLLYHLPGYNTKLIEQEREKRQITKNMEAKSGLRKKTKV